MTEDRREHLPDQPAGADEELEEELVDEQHAIELPAREAFSVVFSSPTFLQAGGIAEEVLPDEPGPAGPE